MTRNISCQNHSMSEYQNQRRSATESRVSFVSMEAGLNDKLKTLLGNFKFEYSLTKDDIRRRKLVKNQVMIFESSSMPVACYSMRAEQRHYDRNKIATPVVY